MYLGTLFGLSLIERLSYMGTPRVRLYSPKLSNNNGFSNLIRHSFSIIFTIYTLSASMNLASSGGFECLVELNIHEALTFLKQ